jgi:hypothetical protein
MNGEHNELIFGGIMGRAVISGDSQPQVHLIMAK